MTCTPHEPTAGNAEFSCERRKSGNGPKPRTAVLIALETIAPGDDRGYRIAVPPCQCSNVIHRDITNPGRPLGRIGARGFHVSIEPQYVLSYERMIQASGPFQLHGKGPGENHIRAGTHGQMEMCLFGHFDPPRIDHYQPRAIALGGVNLPHQMQIAARRVVAPHDDELRKTDLLERCTGGCAESAGVGRAADAAT